jgi:hypothetical protein
VFLVRVLPSQFRVFPLQTSSCECLVSLSLIFPNCVWALAAVAGFVLELADQKARVFLVLIIFTRWFFKHVRNVFVEMAMRI